MPWRVPKTSLLSEWTNALSHCALLPLNSRWVVMGGPLWSLNTRMTSETKVEAECKAHHGSYREKHFTNYSIFLILLVTKTLLPVSLWVKVKDFSVTCKVVCIVSPRPSYSDPGTLTTSLVPRKVPRPFPPHRLCSFCSLCSFSRYLILSTLPSSRSLLKCHWMARPSLTSLFNVTTVLSLHPSSLIIPIVLWISVE